MKKLIKKLTLVLLIILVYNLLNVNKSQAYTNHTLMEAVYWLQSKVGTYVDYDTWKSEEFWYQCTDLIYAYYDYLVGYVEWGDANAFLDNDLPDGWYRTKTPTQGDIVVWGPNKERGWPNLSSATSDIAYGHVGIVWTVNADGSIDTIENNGDWKDLQGKCRVYTRNPVNVDCYIHPDFYDQAPTKPKIPTDLLNLGNNFYAYILMSNHLELFNVDVNSQVVLQKGINSDRKQVWNFIRQSDGSYVIKNVDTGKYLDVLNSNDYDGGGIHTFSYNGSNAQRFFLCGTQNNCVIRPACSTIRTVSVDGGVNLAGKKLNTWEYWGVETQLFNIWKVNEAKSSQLNYNANGNNVRLNWTKGKNADKYNIIIKSGTTGNVKEYKKITDIAETSYNISLPAGYYEITVEGWNYFSHDFSNVVKFTIKDTSGIAQHKHSWGSGKVTKAATFIATGLKTYTCSECGKTKTKTIAKPKTIKLKTTSYTYNGKAKKPAVVVTDSKGKTIASSDYSVKYSSNKKVGIATVTIKFKGNYSGTKKLTFKINPKGTSLSKLTKSSKKFKATWKKNTTQTTGYQIQYSTNSKFKSGNKTVTIAKNKTTSTTVNKLKTKKKYYVRIRTYKTVNGKKYYSGWSKVLNVKTK